MKPTLWQWIAVVLFMFVAYAIGLHVGDRSCIGTP